MNAFDKLIFMAQTAFLLSPGPQSLPHPVNIKKITIVNEENSPQASLVGAFSQMRFRTLVDVGLT